MTFIPWTAALKLGVPIIDEQHRVLVDLINALHAAISDAAGARDAIADILEGLLDYTHNHFIVEEVLFQKHGYPDADKHLSEHSGFTGKMMNWLTRFEDGEDVNLEVLDFLKDWLVHHICEEDRAYLPFLRAQNALQARSAAQPLAA